MRFREQDDVGIGSVFYDNVDGDGNEPQAGTYSLVVIAPGQHPENGLFKGVVVRTRYAAGTQVATEFDSGVCGHANCTSKADAPELPRFSPVTQLCTF